MISSSELCAAPRTVVMDDDGGDTFSKQDVRFAADGGIELGAWLLIPDGPSGARPAITMAHGYALTKYHGIAPSPRRSPPPGSSYSSTTTVGSATAAAGLAKTSPPGTAGLWENSVTVRSTRWTRMYAPGEFVGRVSPTPC